MALAEVETPDREVIPVELDPRAARKSGRTFDPAKHFRKLGGRGDYLDVKWRLVWLRSEYPDALVETKMLKYEFGASTTKGNHAIFWARVTLPEGQGSAEAHGSESQNDFGDFFEKAETKAVGRALEYLGYGTTSAADDKEALADSPVDTRRNNRDDDRRDERPRGSRDRDRDERPRERDREEPAPRRESRRDRDDDGFEERPRKPARKIVEVPPLEDDELEDEVQADVTKVFGFPAVEWKKAKLATMPQVMEAMNTAKGHDERKELYRLIVGARWSAAAVAEVKEYWQVANRREEAEDAAGAVLDDDEDDE